MKQPDVIIFDLDDTIVAWDAVAGDVWLRVCREVCRKENLDADTIAEAIRRAGHWYWSDPERHRQGRLDHFRTRRIVVRRAFDELGIDRPELADHIADTYSLLREAEVTIFPGAFAILEELRDRGIRLAMLTNGETVLQRAKIERFNLAPLFEMIIVEEEFGAGKPETDGFLHILQTLQVAAETAWMVGNDLEHDISPCHELGIFSVWVDARGEGLPPDSPVKPDRIVRSISELPDMLDGS